MVRSWTCCSAASGRNRWFAIVGIAVFAGVAADANAQRTCRQKRADSYPGSTIVAHVHYVVSGSNVEEEGFLLEFEGDPFLARDYVKRDQSQHEGLPASYRGIRPVERREDGTWVCRRDLRVARTSR